MHPHYPGTELVQRLGHQKDFKSSKWYLLGWHSLPTKCYRSRFCCYRINYWVNLPNTLLILILEIHPQFLIYFYCFTLEIIILLLSNYSCLHFLSTPPHQPQPNPPPSLASTLPLGFVHVSFIVVPENPSPHYPLPHPLWLLSDCS